MQERNSESMIRGGMFLPALELGGNLQQTIPQRDVIGAIAGWGLVALLETVFQTQVDRVDSQPLGNDVHLRLHGPYGFRYSETSKRTTAQFVSVDQCRGHAYVGDLVRSHSVLERTIGAG